MEMDVELVEETGRSLKRAGESVGALVASIERTVNGLSSVWEGPDARRFVTEWWPQHKATLLAAGEKVAGLGQSALNNAAEQRGISAAPGTSSSGESGVADGGSSAAPVTTPAASANVVEARMRDWWSQIPRSGVNVSGPDIQCVDLVDHYANTIFPGTNYPQTVGALGNPGYALGMWEKANSTYFDRIPAGPGVVPQPGDIIVIGENRYSVAGHVAVVDRVENGQVHVMQQDGNAPSKGAFTGVISSVEMEAARGYLRPRL
jgi:uncharacterized protein YukE